MKLLIKTAATVITLSTIAVGTASAMIPKSDLSVNVHPDAGQAAKVISDLRTGTSKLPSLVSGSHSENGRNAIGTQELRDLIGKHFI